MRRQRIYQGVILSSENEDLAAVAELLAARVRDKLRYQHFESVYELNLHAEYDFIVVDRFDALRDVAVRYHDNNIPCPLLIHLVYADQVDLNRPYQALQPYNLTIALIRQATLDTQDTTLQFDLFERILEVLDAAQ